MPTKYIFVTGGVVSGLGKGITAASLGRLLKARGYKVTMQKFDPYLNVDPGTMNPFQHGEVFVTDDGAETDLDLGHYERFIDENLTHGLFAMKRLLLLMIVFLGGIVQVVAENTLFYDSKQLTCDLITSICQDKDGLDVYKRQAC